MDVVWTIPVAFWNVLGQMAPYLLFGFLFAGVLSVMISPSAVERHLGGKGVWPVVKAAAFGVPLPLCSCGVIPVAASLRRHGASRPATTSFLLSTPQTGVDSIMVTYSLLGPVFAVFRPVAALVSGLLGGAAVAAWSDHQGNGATDAVECQDACCSGDGKGNVFSRILTYGLVTLPRDIGKSLLIGLAIAGVITAAVPDDYFAGMLGGGIVTMLVMMLLGIPVYVCATASVPVAAALVAKGVSPGAALVFLMTGPATNAAAVTTLWQVMGRRTGLIYLGAVAATALASGLVLDHVFAVSGIPAGRHGEEMLPGWVGTVSALALLGVMAVALWPSKKTPGQAPPPGPREQTAEFAVTGMTCDHCIQTVRRALLECPGVARADVWLKPGRATVIGRDFDVEVVRSAVEGLGFGVTEATGPAESRSP